MDAKGELGIPRLHILELKDGRASSIGLIELDSRMLATPTAIVRVSASTFIIADARDKPVLDDKTKAPEARARGAGPCHDQRSRYQKAEGRRLRVLERFAEV